MEEWLYHAADVMGVEMEQVERYVDTTTWEGHPDEKKNMPDMTAYMLYMPKAADWTYPWTGTGY